MVQDNASTATLADLNSINTKVTVRSTSWLDLAMRAWGSEFHAPDRDSYNFSQGRHFDSTDKGRTGIYGVEVYDSFEGDNNWPDVDYNLMVSDQDSTNLLQFSNQQGVVPTAVDFLMVTDTQFLIQETGFRIML
jgi:hypothetical protein